MIFSLGPFWLKFPKADGKSEDSRFLPLFQKFPEPVFTGNLKPRRDMQPESDRSVTHTTRVTQPESGSILNGPFLYIIHVIVYSYQDDNKEYKAFPIVSCMRASVICGFISGQQGFDDNIVTLFKKLVKNAERNKWLVTCKWELEEQSEFRPKQLPPDMSEWVPQPFNLLLDGNPFQYSDHAISSISGTEAFETGIKRRDRNQCVICGREGARFGRTLNYCHIIPKVEDQTVRYELLFYHIRNWSSYSGRKWNRLVLCLRRQRVWSMKQEMAFGCARSTTPYLIRITIIYAGCQR